MINESRPTCVIDCRVSDPQQLKGGGLDDQELICRMVAKRMGIVDENILKIFKKPHSATTTERDDFEEIVDFIKNSEIKVNYYIIKSIDRFTRCGYPEYLKLKAELENVGVRMIDSHGIIQEKINTLAHLGDFKYKWSEFSPSESSEMMEAYKGKAEARDILGRMIGAEIYLVQQGYAVRRPVDGMVNKKIFVNGKNRTIREFDPERGPYFVRMFEMRAEGLADEEIVEKINAMGFKTKVMNRLNKKRDQIIGHRGGIPLNVKQLQRYVQVVEYAGVKCEKWTNHKPIKANYSGIISIDLWNQANRGKKYIKENEDGSLEIIHNFDPNRTKRRLRNNPLFPNKFIRCPLCKELGKNKTFLGSSPVGRSGVGNPTYHCAREHKYLGIPKKVFDESIENFVKNWEQKILY